MVDDHGLEVLKKSGKEITPGNKSDYSLQAHIQSQEAPLEVEVVAGGSSGQQYTEGETDATITGTAVMWEDTSDTLRAASAANPFPVEIIAGSSSSTEYTEGDTDASITGVAALVEGPSNTLRPLQVNASDQLKVSVENASIPVTQSGAWAVTANAGTDLNTSALALEITQSSIDSTLSNIDSNITKADTDDVRQATHDNLNANANIQLGDVDVSVGNPIPVDIVSGSSAGTEYDENDVDATITGVAVLAEGPSNTLRPFQLNASDNLKVNIENASLAVTATDLDIRDLVFATDKVDVSGSTLGANSGVDIGDVTINNAAGAAAVNVQDGGNSITVDGSVTVSSTDLDIRDLVFATDKVDVSGSSVTIGDAVISASKSVVSTVNSSTALLGNGGVFTGTSEEILNYETISVFVFSDQNSATNGLSLERSTDGTNWDFKATFSILASAARFFTIAPTSRYFRLVYTNGTTPQGAFRLQTIYHPTISDDKKFRVDATITDDSNSELVRAIIAAKQPGMGGVYTNINATNGGNLKISVEEFDSGALGQDTMANSVPVAIASDQSAIPVSQDGQWDITDITGTVSLPTGAATETTLANIDSNIITCDTSNIAATNLDIRDLVFATDKVDVSGSTLGANSGVDIGDVTINNASGAAAVNIQDGGNSITVDGTVAATQSGTWNINNISGTVSLPTGAATETTLAAINTKTPSLGQAVMASSVPVVIASNQSAVSVTVSNATLAVTQSTSPWVVDGSGVTQPVSAVSLPLPTGASTSALQTTGNTSLSNIDGKIPSSLTVTSTRLLVDGSGVTQPVSGTVTANQGGTWTVQPGNTANTTPWLVSSKTALTPLAPTFTTVGTGSGVAVAINSNRKGLIITNTSVNTVSLGLSATAVLNSGITLFPGAAWSMDEWSFVTGNVTAIASAAGSNISIQEYS